MRNDCMLVRLFATNENDSKIYHASQMPQKLYIAGSGATSEAYFHVVPFWYAPVRVGQVEMVQRYKTIDFLNVSRHYL